MAKIMLIDNNSPIIYIRPILKKTPYEGGRIDNPTYLIFTFLDVNDNLGKFDPKVYNIRTLKIEESIHLKSNDSNPNKKLSKLNDSYMNLDGLQSRPKKIILGDVEEKVRTRSTFKNQAQVASLSELEPKSINDAISYKGWIKVMQEELD
ncbi:hypothetical protein CR513_10047, partial [Mucuna pruriens]